MKITNNLNLPQAIVDAVKNDDYDPGTSDITVTQLIAPPRIVALRRQFEEHLEEDAADRIWALEGQIMHGILERANKAELAEHRFYMNVLGWKIGGQMDTLEFNSGTLTDWKRTSSWHIKNGTPDEYIQQLNILAQLLLENGLEVKFLRIGAVLRDWSKLEAKRDSTYPQHQIQMLDVPLWSEAKRLDFITGRVIAHQQAAATLPQCTDADRWRRPAKFAVMKQNRDRAVKLCASQQEAEDFIATSLDRRFLSIVERPGEYVRCASYCPVANFCTQHKRDQ